MFNLSKLAGLFLQLRSINQNLNNSYRRFGAVISNQMGKLFLWLIVMALSVNTFAQTVNPDKYDYEPGKPVSLSGSGWSSNESIELQIWRMPSNGDTLSINVNANSYGEFNDQVYYTTTADIGVRFTVHAIGSSGKDAWTVFHDAGGDFNIDFVASAPYTYNHEIGGGAFDDRTIGVNNDVVESLEGGDFKCGDIVTYLAQVVVEDSPADNVPQTIKLDFSFLANTTGQSGAAHSEVVDVFVNYDATDINGGTIVDLGNEDDGGSIIKNITSGLTGPLFANKSELHLSFELTDLEAGEKVVVRIDTRLACDPGSSPTGNLQAAFTNAITVVPTYGDAVPQGEQTIPFKQFGNLPPPLDCTLEPIYDCAGSIVTYDGTADSDVLTGDYAGDVVSYFWSLEPGSSASILTDPTLPQIDVQTGSSGTYTLYLEKSSILRGEVICEASVVITPAPVANSASMEACDSGNGTASFDISSLSAQINGGTGNSVSYHATESDAHNNVNALSSPLSLASGTIYARVFDGSCYSIAMVSLTVNPNPTVQVATSNISCFEAANGSINLSISSGTAPYTIEWTGPNGYSSTNEDIANLAPGTYQAIIADAKGCSTSITAALTEPTALEASISATDILCNGGTSVITVSATGGTGDYTGVGTYEVVAGTYSYTVADVNGCSQEVSITIGEPTALNTDVVVGTIDCNGGTTTIEITAHGGTAPYIGTGVFTVSAGDYSFTVTDANGCISIVRGSIDEPKLLVANAVVTNVTCVNDEGASNDGTIDATVLGGTAPYTFEWTTTDGVITNGTTEDQTGLPSGTYTLVVTDAKGCTATTTETIVAPTPIDGFVIDPIYERPVCGEFEGNTLGVSVSGGSGVYTYQWSIDETAIASGWAIWSGYENSSEIIFTTGNSYVPATFTVLITDSNGCSISRDFNMQPCMAENYCTYTQGFYGNEGGADCNVDGKGRSAEEMMTEAMNQLGGSTLLGYGNINFELTLRDVTSKDIFNMLPGGKTPAAMKGYATYSQPTTWKHAPLSTKRASYGRIENNLLSQTMTLMFNLELNPGLGSRTLDGQYLITAESRDCGTNLALPYSQQYTIIPQSVLDYLSSNYSRDVNGLFQLANDMLGEKEELILSSGRKNNTYHVSPADITMAVDAINRGFDKCRIFIGFENDMETLTNARGGYGPTFAGTVEIEEADLFEEIQTINVTAYPNPFAGKLSIDFTSYEDTQATVEIFDLQGNRVEVLFDGEAERGVVYQMEFDASELPAQMYIYRISTNNGVKIGKVLSTN